MFRVITVSSPPAFFLLCDNRWCNWVTQVGINKDLMLPPTLPGVLEQHAQAFIKECVEKLGWRVGLDAHECPGCTKRREARNQAVADAGGKKVLVATAEDMRRAQQQVGQVGVIG